MTIWNENDPIKIEKKRIVRTANAIGLAFILGTVVSTVLQFFVVKSVPNEILTSKGGIWAVQILFSTFIFTLPFIFMTPAMNTRVSVACNFKKAEKGLLLPIVLMGLGVCVVANTLGSTTASIFYSLGFSDPETNLSASASDGILLPIISVLGGACLPGLIEEFALRGIVLGALKKFGNSFAIIASAFLFSIMHSTFSQMPFAFIIGIYLGFAVVRTGSMWPAIIIHTLNNLFAFLTETCASVLTEKNITIINILYCLLMVALGFVGLYLSREKDVFTMREIEGEAKLTLSQKLKVFLSSAGIISYIVIIALQIVLLQIMKVLGL